MAKVLIIEDDIMLLETTKFRLEANGYEVITAENGKDGSFKAMSEKPDIMLVDLMMPEVDGFETIKIVRSNSDLKNTPIIVVSALGREEDIKKAKDAGANDFVTKPYSADELLGKIKDFLS